MRGREGRVKGNGWFSLLCARVNVRLFLSFSLYLQCFSRANCLRAKHSFGWRMNCREMRQGNQRLLVLDNCNCIVREKKKGPGVAMYVCPFPRRSSVGERTKVVCYGEKDSDKLNLSPLSPRHDHLAVKQDARVNKGGVFPRKT
jgi:hypothetical protein